MEIWSNPLILNLSQFQEADRHGTGSQRSLSETGRAGRDLAADPKTGGELFFSNISRQLTRLKLGGRQTCVRTYLTRHQALGQEENRLLTIANTICQIEPGVSLQLCL